MAAFPKKNSSGQKWPPVEVGTETILTPHARVNKSLSAVKCVFLVTLAFVAMGLVFQMCDERQ